MRQRFLIASLVFLGFVLSFNFVLAATKNIIFDLTTLTNGQSAGLWQIFNNTQAGLSQRDDGLILESDGDAYLFYNNGFSYRDYDQLSLVVSGDKPLSITVIPDVSTTGYHTYELRRQLETSGELKEVKISLRLPFFREKISDLGIRFESNGPAEIFIKEISLQKLNSGELLLVAVKDYWRVFEYSPFTVNLFAAPRIFGRSGLVYFLPFIAVLVFLLLFSRKWRRVALILLLTAWILIDFRMMYEFLNYHRHDYVLYVRPDHQQKQLRTYGDFYQFADFVKNNLDKNQKVSFYNGGSSHFPRLLQYLAYPIVIYDEKDFSDTYLVYQRQDISYNEQDGALYLDGIKLSESGKIIRRYDDFSFIFQEQ